MDAKNKLVDLLGVLNAHNPADCEGDLIALCEINTSKTCQQADLDPEKIPALIASDIHAFNPDDSSPIWKYICLNFHLLNNLRQILDNSAPNEVLSVQQSKNLKTVIRNICGIGICANLQPNMPKYRQLPVDDNWSILISYNRLVGTTVGLITCLKCIKLRAIILGEGFKPILSAFYQILYCPLKKPKSGGDFMTEEIYEKLLKDRGIFRNYFDEIMVTVHGGFYVRETMTLVDDGDGPKWLQNAIAQNLNSVMKKPKGVETIVNAMLESSMDFDGEDTTKTWKVLDVITKLIFGFYGSDDFEKNICPQLIGLLKLKAKAYENIYVLCMKKLFAVDEKLCKDVLLAAAIEPFVNLSSLSANNNNNNKFRDEEDITDAVGQAARLSCSCICADNNVDRSDLPVELFTPVINVMFRLHSLSLKFHAHELREVLVKYLLESSERILVAFDAFLFGLQSSEVNKCREDLYLEVRGDSLVVRLSPHKNLTGGISGNGEALMNLCKDNPKLKIKLFTYLLNCLTDREKYFKIDAKKDLLQSEDTFIMDEAIERKLTVYQLLSSLAEDQQVKQSINDNPEAIVKYIENVLANTLATKLHLTDEEDSDHFQTVFTIVMILQALVMNSDSKNFQQLLGILETLFSQTKNLELKKLIKSIIDAITNNAIPTKKPETKSDLDQAIEDVCDPMLPVRGHGLMTLTKLVETRNPEIMERKQYVFNIFQQNLKNDDSFIYLSAVGGLAAMGDVFPDGVIKVLAQEYSDFVKKEGEDSAEIRMKIGEVLVRITKKLGEIAPKYKSLLLNSFLSGTKDDDHLIRASSLSNLGEICRVLGYKLGSIVTEVLVCVHAIIATDKAVEARRAAVTVIRQLLAGLESEMIAFLKEDILEIYRTLKNVYQNDRDDIMRLQAQLALEELNENMRNFVFPKPQINMDKKIVVLK